MVQMMYSGWLHPRGVPWRFMALYLLLLCNILTLELGTTCIQELVIVCWCHTIIAVFILSFRKSSHRGVGRDHVVITIIENPRLLNLWNNKYLNQNSTHSMERRFRDGISIFCEQDGLCLYLSFWIYLKMPTRRILWLSWREKQEVVKLRRFPK